MKLNLKTIKSLALAFSALFIVTACSSDDNSTPDVPKGPSVNRDFQVAFASGSGNPSMTYLQGVTDIATGSISFSKKGFEMPSTRTARIFTSSDGKFIYNLNYTVGTLVKFEYKGGQNYVKVGEIDSAVPLGTKTGRFTKINDNLGSVQYITSQAIFSDEDKKNYEGHKMTASIGLFDLNTMTIKPGYQKSLDIKLDEKLTKEGYHIWRLDTPVLVGNKLYYGAGLRRYDHLTGKNVDYDKTMVLVLDYNDLTKYEIIFGDYVEGATNGYRTPTLYNGDNNSILVMATSDTKTFITKIVNGKFDESFVFDLNKALGGVETSSNGWFYVGDGIGYVTYEKVGKSQVQIGVDKDGKPTYSSPWGVARVNLKDKTAVDLDVPAGLWLFQYQTAVARDGIFYIALAPVGGKGNIYMFDVKSTSPKGKLGAEITAGADQYYIGVY